MLSLSIFYDVCFHNKNVDNPFISAQLRSLGWLSIQFMLNRCQIIITNISNFEGISTIKKIHFFVHSTASLYSKFKWLFQLYYNVKRIHSYYRNATTTVKAEKWVRLCAEAEKWIQLFAQTKEWIWVHIQAKKWVRLRTEAKKWVPIENHLDSRTKKTSWQRRFQANQPKRRTQAWRTEKWSMELRWIQITWRYFKRKKVYLTESSKLLKFLFKG